MANYGGFGPAASMGDRLGLSNVSRATGTGLTQWLGQDIASLRSSEGGQLFSNALSLSQALGSQKGGQAPQAAPAMANSTPVQLSRQTDQSEMIRLLLQILAQGQR